MKFDVFDLVKFDEKFSEKRGLWWVGGQHNYLYIKTSELRDTVAAARQQHPSLSYPLSATHLGTY